MLYSANITPGDERLVDEDEEEGADCEDDDTDDDDDDDEQEMRVFGDCEELEEFDEEYEDAGNLSNTNDVILQNTTILKVILSLHIFTF